MRRGFTLIELLVVIAIIAILAVVVVLTLNPAELLRQSRDSNRVSDMSTLNEAVNLYSTDQGGASGYSLGSANTVYVSIPDPSATSTAGDQCQGLGLISLPSTYTYHCAASSTYRNVNGTGWIPINFSTISTGSPLGSLPVDPTNSSSSRLYYT
jgi:prepilin-type N-terminal cleavage/methylation domain-containing protein